MTKEQFRKEYSEARLWLRRSYESMRYLPCGADDAAHERLANYHITFSDSGSNARMVALQPKWVNTAVVFSSDLPATWKGKIVVNGDANDLRFLDPQGVIVGLKAKGEAKAQKNNKFVKIG